MGSWNFRSLLLAAIVLNSCISWTASRHHFTHNVSGQRSRYRRQGAGLFLTASFVLPGGEGSGAWGEWGEVSPCSRTCGGGVYSQKRICLEVGPDGVPLCKGGDTKYFSCSTQDCPEDSMDFRAEQCAEFNDKLFKDVKYNWIPYTRGMNPCELNCRPRGERFYYRHRQKVVDGTRCNDENFDVCVDGQCQPVGCDRMLGSTSREDKCRVCNGNGTDCHTVKGLLDSQDLIKGYNDILLIPDGATSIFIAEVRPSNNYLALRSKFNNVYYLNGDYHIDFPRPLPIAGAIWHYERNQLGFNAPDILRSQGPITEPLYLSLLLQGENVGIKYEYSIPRRLAPPVKQKYNWVMEEFSQCSTTCGGGQQTRNVSCRADQELNVVDDSLCDEGLKPITSQICNQEACPPQWIEEPWSPCSKRCGEGGVQSRKVLCQKIISDGVPLLVPDKECFDLLGPRPELFRECNKDAVCPTWFTGHWKHCDKFCGEGKQSRQVVCHRRVKGRVEVLPDEECEEEKPPAEQTCTLKLCEGVDWVLTDWTGCDTCLSTVRTRTMVCAVNISKVVDDSFCSHHSLPILEEACDPAELPSCTMQWYATQWGKCSVECGKGIQSRLVFCGKFDGAGVTKVEDSKCDPKTKYNTTKPCEVPPEECPAKWFAGPWTECDQKCGSGAQDRQVMCFIGDQVSTKCNPSEIPDSTQSCNTGSCNIDDVMPVNSSAPPITDEESEECEEEIYPEAAVIELGVSTVTAPDETTTEPFTKESSFAETDFTEGSGEEKDITGVTDDTYKTTAVDNKTENPHTRPPYEHGVNKGFDIEDSELDVTSTEDSATSPEYTSSSTDSTEVPDSYSTEDTSEAEYEYTSKTEEDTSYTLSESSEDNEEITTNSESKTTTETTESLITTIQETKTTDTDDADNKTTDGTTEKVTTLNGMEVMETTTSGSAKATESTSTEITSTNESTTTETTELSSVDSTGATESTTTEITELSSTDTTEATESTTTEITELSSTDTTEATESTTTEITELSSTDTTEATESSTTEISELSSTTEDAQSTTTEMIPAETTEVETTIEMNTTESGTTVSYQDTGSTISETKPGSSTTTEITLASDVTESTTNNDKETAGTTESSVNKTTESATTNSNISEPISTTETVTESNITETVLIETTTSGSTTELSSTEITSTNIPDATQSTIAETTESTIAETTESTIAETTEMGSTTTLLTKTTGTDEVEAMTEAGTTESGITTPWTWASTIEGVTSKGKKICKPKKKPNCHKTTFGCCPDGLSQAAGPFDKGCPETCKDSYFGCCPDGVSAALGPEKQGCIEPCNETLFGCCLSDNVTAAQGNDQEGCPPPPPACKFSQFGCCSDNETEAAGPNKEGCYSTAMTESTTESETESTTVTETACEEGTCSTETQTTEQLSTTVTETVVTSTTGSPCSTFEFGCCSDGETPAHGPEEEGCCVNTPFGCCPDNYSPAQGPSLEGCGCQFSHYGCCPDNETIARGPHNEGCGCQYTPHGCCPDRHTEAFGPNYEGCGCHTYQFGCCPDGVLAAKGPRYQGCRCEESRYGCCGDGQTAAVGDNMLGCDCASSKYGCCPDGKTAAQGTKFQGCTDVPENRQAACSLPIDRGSCRNYTVQWYFEPGYGGCSRFWYGGCGGNGNRFSSEDECKDVCINPPPKDACNLPKIKGSCPEDHRRWYYDTNLEQCLQFIYGGCLGNANNFQSREACIAQCEPPKSTDQCELAIEAGPCAGTFGRWGFNTETRSCEQFIWGGCEGNINRFTSEAACMQRCSPPGVQKAECLLPKDVGNCTEKQAMWTFKEGRCMPFYYTGCGGNANRFNSEKDCAEACPTPYEPDVCTLPREEGDCSDYRLKWYYDTAEQSCRQFYYGGCGGNGNSFDSQQECEYRCTTEAVTTTIRTTTTQKTFETDICQLPMRTGPCKDSQIKWFYDKTTHTCSRFMYSGCDGNDNRFETVDDCQRRCRSGPAAPPPTRSTPTPPTAPSVFVPPQCRISPTLEPCQDAGEVWFLDIYTRECTPFINAAEGEECRRSGVFPSREDCEYACADFPDLVTRPVVTDICELPLQSGSCNDLQIKWFYDKTTDTCSRFSYSGCDGNDNRFETVDDCQRRCKSGSAAPAPTPPTAPSVFVPPQCRISPMLEPCQNAGEVWFLDIYTRECTPFRNAAEGEECRSSGVFPSREDCEYACAAFPDLVTRPGSTLIAKEPNVCTLPSEAGDCWNWTLRWFYDNTVQRCSQFYYGGCGGNGNSFDTEQDCQYRCSLETVITTLRPTTTQDVFGPEADVCTLPSEVGDCWNYTLKWFYDTTVQRCRQFYYGGCGGNGNSFDTEQDCQYRCPPQAVTTTLRTTTTQEVFGPDACQQTPDPGTCNEYLIRWYYDKTQDICSEFVFSGCGGNDNRFETINDCEGRCRQRSPLTTTAVQTSLTSTTTTPLTELPPVVQAECLTPESLSPCGRNITAYYYDSERRVCRAGSIGDCNYRNKYRSEEECERRCGQFVGRDVCGSHLDPGPCREQVIKYYWDKLNGRCLRYTYGGCDGGPNRFSTAEECEEMCGPRDSACKQNLDTGSSECGAPASRRWYYSTDRGNCLAFIYKGCEGNQNNFITPELCASTCSNEVLPDCDRYNEECENIRCEFGVQRMHTAENCEKCSCVQVDVDCTPFKQDCENLICTYGVIRTTEADGCERCTCTDHPCANTNCPEGERCVPIASLDSATNEVRYSAVCRTVNKPGICPPTRKSTNQTSCRTECYDDADCQGPNKCCSRGCSHLCLEPFSLTTLMPYTTHIPGPHAPEPNVEETKPMVTAHEGGKATLRCLFHSNPPPKITWRRGEITIDGDVDRYRLLSDGTLEIVSLYRNDSGVYICVADNGLGVAEQEVHLQVHDPVELQASISGAQNAVVEGTYGGTIYIHCLAYGHPEPTVNWYRGLTGAMVPYFSNLYEARGNVLLIKELNQETLGEYACQAYNGIGKPASWTVTVQARQDHVVPILPPRLVVVTPRRPYTETTVRQTTVSSVPDIQMVTRYTVPVSVRVQAEQTTVPAGSQINLQCEADGYPEPTVYWNKDGVRLVNSDRTQIYGSRLTISNVNVDDNGVYECFANNDFTSDSRNVRITVEGLFIPSYCSDNPLFANCKLIVRSKFCTHKYYSTFCCKSCAEAGQLNPQDLLRMQADQPFSRRK